MQPRFETLTSKKLAGRSIRMSLQQNKTAELWRSFMPKKHTITTNVGSELYSVDVYDSLQYFNNFDLKAEFNKWAAIEVRSFDSVPPDMQTLELNGLYAVFVYKGPASEGHKMYRYIFQEWLPGSDFVLDHRPHFALMGEKYKHEDPSSEEELWVPVKPK